MVRALNPVSAAKVVGTYHVSVSVTCKWTDDELQSMTKHALCWERNAAETDCCTEATALMHEGMGGGHVSAKR